jgi:hypothetical protein
MSLCNQVSITNDAFDNLIGIKSLCMYGCQPRIIEFARSIGLPVTTNY